MSQLGSQPQEQAKWTDMGASVLSVNTGFDSQK
jgi:hypothetical protein